MTRPVCPARKRSWASALRLGRSSTRLPRLTRVPAIITASVAGSTAASRSGSHHGTSASSPVLSAAAGRGRGGTRRAQRVVHRPVQPRHVLRRELLAAVEDLGGPRVGGPCLCLLLSVIVRIRRVRISSISVESNSEPGLCAASVGWSSRMIGDTSATSSSPAGPASTGQHRCCRQSRAAVASPAGGSVIDTNSPPVQPSSRWAPRNDRRVAVAAAIAPGVRRRRPPTLPRPPTVRCRRPRRLVRRVTGSAARHDEPEPRHPGHLRHGEGRPTDATRGHRRRMTRPAVTVGVLDLRRPVHRDRHRRLAPSVRRAVVTGTSCSTASSQESQRCPSTHRSGTGTNPLCRRRVGPSRACSCRKRSVTVTAARLRWRAAARRPSRAPRPRRLPRRHRGVRGRRTATATGSCRRLAR